MKKTRNIRMQTWLLRGAAWLPPLLVAAAAAFMGYAFLSFWGFSPDGPGPNLPHLWQRVIFSGIGGVLFVLGHFWYVSLPLLGLSTWAILKLKRQPARIFQAEINAREQNITLNAIDADAPKR